MTPQLRLAWGDVASHLIGKGSPLGVARLISIIGLRSSWRFGFRVGSNDETILEAGPVGSASEDELVDRVLSGLVPELLNSHSVSATEGKTTRIFAPLEENLFVGNREVGLPDPQVLTHEDRNEVKIGASAYYGYRVDPSLTDESLVGEYLRRNTWLGSLKYSGKRWTVTWKVLARVQVHSFDSLVGSSRGDIIEIPSALGTMRMVIANRTSDETVIRHSEYGEFGDLTHLEPIEEALRAHRLPGYVFELDTDAFELVAPGHISLTRHIDEEVLDAAQRIRRSRTLGKVAKSLQSAKRERATWLLNARIREAQVARRVMYRGKEIGREPKSELGTVALFHKLEGMGGLPFASFNSIAWAAAEGIDMIADVQLREGEALRAARPVEFEYSFRSFIEHRHPHEHVELIICWFVDPSSRRRLEVGEEAWLWWLAVVERKVPVVELRNLPHLEIASW